MLLVDEDIDDNTQADSLAVPEGEPYSRTELQRVVDGLPTRGPVCPKCHMHIPQFRDLSLNDEARVRDLIRRNQNIEAMRELRVNTNCPISWAKLWVMHSGRPEITMACPYCDKPLKTARAKQCQHCMMDWHDPGNPKRLGQ